MPMFAQLWNKTPREPVVGVIAVLLIFLDADRQMAIGRLLPALQVEATCLGFCSAAVDAVYSAEL